MTIAIVCLSFGKRTKEPNPVNVGLARQAEDIVDWLGEELVVVSQSEISQQLKQDGYAVDLTVTQQDATYKDKKIYLDTQDVLEKLFEVCRAKAITKVIVVANPFLHLKAAQKAIKRAGLTVISQKISRVGFDNSPLQLKWWCRGPIRLVIYGSLVTVGHIARFNLHGFGEREPG